MQTDTPKIPGYAIDEKNLLGTGGFAKVYLAKHTGLQINVALKVMDANLANDIDFCKRFLLEARTCANLGNHPSIIHIYDVGCVGNLYYIAMQYLSGSNLREIMDSGEPYNHPLEILRPIVDALGYAHERGVVHRDVKPANILFNESGRAMLADFGIAKSLQNENTQLTAAGAAIGTAAYMSPEQAKALSDIDGRSDLYSIGVLLYEMLCGEKPYQAKDQMGLMLQHVNDPVPTLPDSEKKYQKLISKLMAKEPDDRYQDHHTVLAEMDALLRSPEQSSTPVKKHLVLGGGIAAAAVLTAAAGFLLLNQERSESPFVSVPSAGDLVEPSVVENSVEDTPPPSVAASEDSPKVKRLLELAKMHEEFNELTSPPGSNALELYESVLQEDPEHSYAQQRRDELIQLTDN
ncbi:MAG: serine/threonine protein kinase [Granulosicoccus sp.]